MSIEKLQVLHVLPVVLQKLQGLACHGSNLWLLGAGQSRLLVVDALTGVQLRTLEFDAEISGFTLAPPWLWLVDRSVGVIYGMDLQTGEIRRHIELIQQPAQILLSGDAKWLWQVDASAGIARLTDIERDRIEQVIELDCVLSGFCSTPTTLYYCEAGSAYLNAFDLQSMRRTQRWPLPGIASWLSGDGRQFYYYDAQLGQVCQLTWQPALTQTLAK